MREELQQFLSLVFVCWYATVCPLHKWKLQTKNVEHIYLVLFVCLSQWCTAIFTCTWAICFTLHCPSSSSSVFDVMAVLTRSLSHKCRLLGCQEQIFCRPPELGFEGHTSGPYLLPCLVVEWAGLQLMWWCLVRFSTWALSWGLYSNPLEMAIQSAVACYEVKDGGLFVSWHLIECVLVWVVSSSLAVGDGFLFIADRSFDFSVGQVFLFPSIFCELICYFISPNGSVCLYPLKNNTGRLSEGADVLCELLL